MKLALRGRAGRLAVAGLLAVLAVASSAYLYLAQGSGAAANAYGPLPTWLPKATTPVGRVVTASAAHPALAIEGDTVRMALAHGSALATLVGPDMPGSGKLPVPETVRCTFTLKLARESGTVPLRGFTLLDEYGNTYRPAVTVHGSVITLITVLPTGSGQLRWTPDGVPVASWDFDVEVD